LVDESEIASATLDTNVFPAEALVQRAGRLGIEAAVITVSRREVEGSTLEEEVSALESIAETGVFGESRYGEAVYGAQSDAECIERALELLSNRAFPGIGNRETMTNGQRRQLRDAMILCAHVRSKRDVLVSNDRKAFVDNGRREAIAAMFCTSVMTVAEFEQHLLELERNRRPAV
jgi:hypothetical protein